MKIFQFLNIAVTASLDFRICEISLADSLEGQTHHRARCRQNRSFRCGDIAIFRIFKIAAWGVWWVMATQSQNNF